VCIATERIEDVLDSIPGEGDSPVFLGGRGRRACFLTREEFGVKIELTEHEPIEQKESA